jgi:predicted transcriptional regulator
MTNEPNTPAILASKVSQIVAAYASNNEVTSEQLLVLIKSVHLALSGLTPTAEPTTDALVPAVPIKKSVFPDHIICLEDGMSFKMLKRHLLTDHGMTPEHYRERWGLPGTYPMVSSDHSAKRSALAKGHGLGRNPRTRKASVEVGDSPAEVDVAVRRIPAGKRGKPRKVALDDAPEDQS